MIADSVSRAGTRKVGGLPYSCEGKENLPRPMKSAAGVSSWRPCKARRKPLPEAMPRPCRALPPNLHGWVSSLIRGESTSGSEVADALRERR